MAKSFPPDSQRNNENALRRSLRDLMRGPKEARDTPEEDDGAEPKDATPDRPEESPLLRSLMRDPAPETRDSRPPARISELQRLEVENEELQNEIAELRQKLDAAAEKGQGSFEEQERAYESMLEDKSEEIRGLYVRIQELKEAVAAGGGTVGGALDDNDADMQAMSDDLERERQQLEEERQRLEEETRQIREDEDDLMRRMREMELQTAKGRADLARQHNELHQLHNEVRRELEQAQSLGANSDRVRSIQKQHQEVNIRRR